MDKRQKFGAAAIFIVIAGLVGGPYAYAVLTGGFSDSVWTVPTMKADNYYVGSSTKLANSSGVYATEFYRAGTALPAYLASLGVGTTVTQASPYSYVVFKDGGTYYANSTTGATNYSGAAFTTVLENAINAADGQSIYIKAGEYTVTSQIDITKNVVISGAGMNATKLKAGAALNDDLIYYGAAAATETKLVLTDLTLDGDRGTGQVTDGMGLFATSSAYLQRVKIQHIWGTGALARVGTKNAAYPLTVFSLVDCELWDCGVHGSVGPAIRGHRAATAAHRIEDFIVQNCYIHDTNEHGVKIYYENGDSSANNAFIIGNKFERCDSTGISLGAKNATVTGNQIIHSNYNNPGADGIVIEDTGKYIISGNVIQNVGTNGLGIRVNTGVEGFIISDNYITDTATAGIYCYVGGEMHDNHIIDGTYGIYLQSTASYSQISGGVIEDVTTGIYNAGDYNRISGVDFRGTITTGINHVAGADNNSVFNCDLNAATTDITDAGASNIAHCYIDDGGTYQP